MLTAEGDVTFRVAKLLDMQPEAFTLYVIVVDPRLTPVATPELLPMVATAGMLLLHVPPGVAFANTVVPPAQILNEPVMGVIAEPTPTVTVSVAKPVPHMLVIV
jgi:hypothetical protein